MHGHKRWRERLTIMDDFDDVMMSFALRDAFPNALITTLHPGSPKPELRLYETIVDVKVYQPPEIYFPEPGWKPAFERQVEAGDHMFINAPRHSLQYSRSEWFWGVRFHEHAKWSFSLPTPEHGLLASQYDTSNPEDRAFVKGVWSVLNKLMTNRLKEGLWPDPVSVKNAGSDIFWAGHHVLQWCRERPDRMIVGSRRPCDDWEPPDTPWHRNLRARVIEKYGPNFGGPPATGRPV